MDRGSFCLLVLSVNVLLDVLVIFSVDVCWCGAGGVGEWISRYFLVQIMTERGAD